MKKYIIIGTILGLLLGIFSIARADMNLWYLSSNNVRPNVGTWGIQVPSLGGAGNPCVTVDASGVFSTTPCSGGGGVATSSVLTQGQWVIASGPGSIYSTSSQPAITAFSPLSISPTGTILCFACLTSSTGVTTFNGSSGAVTGVSSLNFIYGDLQLSVRASGTVPTFETNGGVPMYVNFPVAGSQFYAPSTTIPVLYVSSFNGSTGAIVFSSAPTSTINGFTGTVFDVLAGSGLSRSVVNGSTTFYGVATSTSQRWTANQYFSFASTTQLYSASTTLQDFAANALVWANATGKLSAYGGTGCAAGNAITVLNASGTATCGAFLSSYQASTTINNFTGQIFDILAGSGLSRSLSNGSTTFYGVATSTAQLWTATQQFTTIASTSQLYANSSTIQFLSDASGNKYVTSTAISSVPWTIANDTSDNVDVIKIFYLASTLRHVDCVQNASGTETFMMSFATSTTNPTSTDRNIFNGNQVVAQRTATSSAINATTTANANDMLRIWTIGNTSSTEFHCDVSYTVP